MAAGVARRRVVRPDGLAVVLDYDVAGRPSSLRFSRGQIGYPYHPATRQLTGVTAPDGQNLAFTYDGFLPLRTTWSGPVAGTVDRAYDNDFRVTSLTVGGTSAVTFAYDRDSLLTRAGSLTLTRDAGNGLLTGTTLGRVTTARTWNGFAEPATFAARLDGAPILSMSYERDRLGRIVRKEETLGGATDVYLYSYDPAGRLIAVEKNGVILSQYEYDPNGNRLSRTTPNGTETAEYDAQDRLMRYRDTAYAWTANGELASKTRNGQTIAYDYDELGNLRVVDLPNGLRIEYLIDGTNRRVGKKVNGVQVQGFLYKDQLEPVAELNGSGQIVAVFVYGSRPHVPDYLVNAGRTYRIVSDHLGSPRLVIDTGTGEVVQQMDYDEFGRVILDTNPRFQPFGFAGGIYDPHTGFVRFGARDYDAEVGRWTAKDPIGFEGGAANLYVYISGDSINLIDRDGLAPKDKRFGLPDAFWEWHHRQNKTKGKQPNIDREEAEWWHEQWKEQGQPDAEGHRRRPPIEDPSKFCPNTIPAPPPGNQCVVTGAAVGAVAGGIIGGVLGGAGGTYVAPGLGTAAGAVAGGEQGALVGGVVGAVVGGLLGDLLCN